MGGESASVQGCLSPDAKKSTDRDCQETYHVLQFCLSESVLLVHNFWVVAAEPGPRKLILSAITASDLEAFVRLFEMSDWSEVDVIVSGIELRLRKSSTGVTSRITWVPRQGGLASGTANPANDLQQISAPHLGTLRHRVQPGGFAILCAGDSVGPDTVLCTLEVMERVIEIKAGIDGSIRQVCFDDGALVQYDDILFVLDATRASSGSN
jgi:acetyl-CoA carboxylase biotin carboxyl carrier protein